MLAAKRTDTEFPRAAWLDHLRQDLAQHAPFDLDQGWPEGEVQQRLGALVLVLGTRLHTIDRELNVVFAPYRERLGGIVLGGSELSTRICSFESPAAGLIDARLHHTPKHRAIDVYVAGPGAGRRIVRVLYRAAAAAFGTDSN